MAKIYTVSEDNGPRLDDWLLRCGAAPDREPSEPYPTLPAAPKPPVLRLIAAE